MKTRLLLAEPPKRILIAGSIRKYVVAGEQKAIVNVVAPDEDRESQEYARRYFNGMFKKFIHQ